MGTPTQYYVNDAYGVGNDGYDGTSATPNPPTEGPWKTLAHALSASGIAASGRDTNNGDQINITGTQVLSDSIDPTADYDGGARYGHEPLILRGYGTTINDGTRATIDGNDGNFTLFSGGSNSTHIIFIDLTLKDSGTGKLAQLSSYNTFINCVITGSSGTGLDLGIGCVLSNCRLYDIGSNGIAAGGFVVNGCRFDNSGTETMTYAIKFDLAGSSTIPYFSTVDRCFVYFDSTSNAFDLQSTNTRSDMETVPAIIRNCSLYTSGTGIYGINGSDRVNSLVCENNAIEGFGTGFRWRAEWNLFHGGNVGYDNADNFDDSGRIIFTWGATTNEDGPAGSPFEDMASGPDFSASDVGSVAHGAEPTPIVGGPAGLSYSQGLSKGAAQRTPAAAAGGPPVSQGLHTIETGITA